MLLLFANICIDFSCGFDKLIFYFWASLQNIQFMFSGYSTEFMMDNPHLFIINTKTITIIMYLIIIVKSVKIIAVIKFNDWATSIKHCTINVLHYLTSLVVQIYINI